MGLIKKKIGNNIICQVDESNTKMFISADQVKQSWKNAFCFKSTENETCGLRAAQLGAIYAIKAHWTVSTDPATIVMPTGTGKTETMIATVVSEAVERTLIIVPSNLLRKQTAKKFLTFGILTDIGVITTTAKKPVVATLTTKPPTLDDLNEIIYQSNVIVTTMPLLQRFTDEYVDALSSGCDALIVDEAHHIAANTWTTIKHKLKRLRCLQFTATPFRNDGKKIDGEIIYNFPLSKAQEQGYFMPINFKPVFEFDEEKGDMAIAKAAVQQLEEDLKAGYNHLVLVRAKTKKFANHLFETIYQPNFSKFNPVLLHSDTTKPDKDVAMKALNEGTSKIVVCVDMFGEGIDIPGLKIAAIHEKYKSLPITLQFIGRFARAKEGLGNATVITNIANDELNESLQELYAQDSDWNSMLNILADKEISKEVSLQNLSKGFDRDSLLGITIQQLRPKVSMEAYKTEDSDWNPNKIYDLFDVDTCFITVNREENIIVIIEKESSEIKWTSFKGIFDMNWNLHLVYWNPTNKIVFVNSTNKGISKDIVEILFSDAKKISGEQVFRCLHGIKRLMLGTIGLKSAINGPIRFRMFAGIDIGNGILQSQKETSFKSNLFGIGYNGKGKVSIGCSYKGRIWSRWVENINFWKNWCDEMATKLLNEGIDTKTILDGALIPVIVNERPKAVPYGIEWPIDLDLLNDNSYLISDGENDYPIYDFEIGITQHNETGPLTFYIKNETLYEEYELSINEGSFNFNVIKSGGLTLKKRNREYKVNDFFNEYPPTIKFVDQSMIEGNIQVKLSTEPIVIEKDRFINWKWDKVDIKKESQGRHKEEGTIQHHLIKQLIKNDKYSIIFDDDDAGEIADVLAFIDEGEHITIHFFHCKYSHGDKPGARVADLYEVCGQAEKSVKWCQEPTAIIDRLIRRETARRSIGGTRFEVGNMAKLKEIRNKMKVFQTKFEITIVQPGVDKELLSDGMLRIISGSASYLMDTYGIELQIICS